MRDNDIVQRVLLAAGCVAFAAGLFFSMFAALSNDWRWLCVALPVSLISVYCLLLWIEEDYR